MLISAYGRNHQVVLAQRGCQFAHRGLGKITDFLSVLGFRIAVRFDRDLGVDETPTGKSSLDGIRMAIAYHDNSNHSHCIAPFRAGLSQ
jgi:hypothetical protein